LTAVGEPDFGPLHPSLGVHVVFLSVSRADEIYVRVVLECHEGMGVARAHDVTSSPHRTLLSLLVVPDFASDACALLLDLAREADVAFLACDPEQVEQVVRELE
jgi:hypothetical protein